MLAIRDEKKHKALCPVAVRRPEVRDQACSRGERMRESQGSLTLYKSHNQCIFLTAIQNSMNARVVGRPLPDLISLKLNGFGFFFTYSLQSVIPLLANGNPAGGFLSPSEVTD